MQLAQRKDGNPVNSVEACPTDGASEDPSPGPTRAEDKGRCSPLQSPSNGTASSHRTNRFSDQGTPDMAEEKEPDRDNRSTGLFHPRDNNIEDVNMNVIGAKSGDKSTDVPAAKVSSRSGSKVEVSVEEMIPLHGESSEIEPDAVTRGLGPVSILAPRGITVPCMDLKPSLISLMRVPLCAYCSISEDQKYRS